MATANESHPLIHRDYQLIRAPNSTTYRVLQYNILADALSFSSPEENFCKVPQDCLAWPFRSRQLLTQINSYNADIICLEEVEKGHFDDFFVPNFPDYEGSYIPKKDSPCFRYSDNHGPDGVAIFFKKARFTSKEVIMKYLIDEDGKEGKNPILVNVLGDRKNESLLIIGATHFKAKRGFEDRRKAQAESCIAVLNEVASKYPSASTVFCGDFNGEPGEIFYTALEDAGYKSAFVEALGEEPQYSTWKIRPSGEERHTIDFVWQRVAGAYEVTGVLEVMKDDDVPVDRFPAYGQPSDHIPLCFDFTKP